MRCPFHEDSSVTAQDGDLSSVQCPHCGEYRISKVALEQISRLSAPPKGWQKVVDKGRLISTRDTRLLLAG